MLTPCRICAVPLFYRDDDVQIDAPALLVMKAKSVSEGRCDLLYGFSF